MDEFTAGLAEIGRQLDVPEQFPAEVLAAADAAIASGPRLDRRDATALPMVTVDPPGARDLDQAVLVERLGSGYRVWYAIADVAAFVAQGDLVDVEASQRGVTLYRPDGRTPLYPEVLGEGAASLLPDGDRPALLWRIDLDAHGDGREATVERATVRSRAQFTYDAVQVELDAGRADGALVLLRDVGRLRQEREQERGGVSLNRPEQRAVAADGQFRLEYRVPLPVEGWNAQISLLTGMTAAGIMIDGRIGLLRTLPPPEATTLAAIRRSARTLGVPWPDGASYAEFVRGVDRTRPAGAALLNQAARALRGSGYRAFDGDAPHGDAARHFAVAAPYAHVTAPLRRLADRYANEVVVALCAGREPAAEVRAALAGLPALMGAAREKERHVAAAVIDFTEAMVLRDRVGETFAATVTNVDTRGAVIQIAEPAVLARLGDAPVELGAEITVRLVEADPKGRRIRFELS